VPQYNVTASAGSQWSESFTFTGTDLTNRTIRLVIRPSVTDTTSPAEVSIDSTAANGQGSITITTSTSTVLVVVNPSAVTALAAAGGGVYTLWMDPGLADQTGLVTGAFYVQQIPQP
jgi:hypothetical protein